MAMATSERTAHPGFQGPPTVPMPVLRAAVIVMVAFEEGASSAAAHPDYLGDAPRLVDDACTGCGFAAAYHVDRGGQPIAVREWHRLDAQRPNGFFADEPVPGVRR